MLFDISREDFTQKLDILWEPVNGGARILRVFGERPCLLLPETIGGLPVTEIGAYCFSRSDPKLPDTYFHHKTAEEEGGTPPLSPLSGSSVEIVILPSTVTTLHNAAFYNCRMLRTLSVGASIRSIGSDEFTNCSRLRQLILRCEDTDSSGLSLLLERIEDDLNVLFLPSYPRGPVASALFFPEYYEWLDEISPAHLFSRSIHGEGFRMRKCFENNRLNYEKYDSCFENALKIESEETICRIAFYRLFWNRHLKDAARHMYENALNKYLSTAVSMASAAKDMSFLLFLCRYFKSTKDYNNAVSLCIQSGWSEGGARLMEEKHQSGISDEKNFSFDEFDGRF